MWDPAGDDILWELALGRTGSAASYAELGRSLGAQARANGLDDRLIALDDLDIQPFEHQRRAVVHVVRTLLGRAVLADEVGLGKTIEAGLILRELWLRGAVKSALILVPATLVWQWWDELAYTLRLPVRKAEGAGADWRADEMIVASLDTAKRPAHRSAITGRRWDMVIVDEAHRLKNRSTINWKFVNAIPKVHCLLLTATPIQNDLRELYNLVTLLTPGKLRTYAAFKREFSWDKRSPKNVPKLRRLISDVMVRTTRRDSDIPAPGRRVRRLDVTLGREESSFYTNVLRTVRKAVQQLPATRRNVLPFILLLREACSSPQAALGTMRTFLAGASNERGVARSHPDWEDLIRRGRNIARPIKFDRLSKLVRGGEERYLVFTEYRATLEMLANRLEEIGVRVVRFHGGMNATEKESAVHAFRQDVGRVQVMVSTDAGAEGRNLQFCRTVVNYDLPWNPMRIEQRIGRVHRLGQRRAVHVWNCVTAGTIEEALLNVLEEKVGLFRAVIGELDAILSELPDGFESSFAKAVLEAPDEDDMHRRLASLGERIDGVWASYKRVRKWNDALFGVPLGADEQSKTVRTAEADDAADISQFVGHGAIPGTAEAAGTAEGR